MIISVVKVNQMYSPSTFVESSFLTQNDRVRAVWLLQQLLYGEKEKKMT